MYDNLVWKLAEKQGITEQLKTDNQMLSAQRMNNIANLAREIINNGIIFEL